MSLPSKIFYNTLAQTVGKIASVAIGLFTLSILTRYLGEQGFGQYSTVLAFMGFVVVLADLGLYLVVVRGISAPGGNRSEIIGNALGLRLATAVCALLAGAALALLFPYDAVVKQTMFVAVLAFLFVPLHQVLMGIFQKHLATHLPTISELAGRLINLALVYFFATEQLGLPYFVAALTAGNAAIFTLTYIFAKRLERFSFAFDLKIWKTIVSQSWPLAFAVILNLTYFKGDTIILSVFHEPEAVGVYSLPYKILEVLLAFPAMFVGVIMPLLSSSAFSDWDRFRKILQRSLDAILLVVAPMLIVTFYFSGEIINLISGGHDFADSPRLLRILIVSAAIIFVGTLFGYAVVAVKKERPMVWGYAAGAVLGFTLYFSLIPRYSYWGAAVSTVIIEAIVAAVAFLLVRKASNMKVSLVTVIKTLPAAAILVLFFHFVHINWAAEAAIGLIIYSAALFALKAVPLSFIREIILRR